MYSHLFTSFYIKIRNSSVEMEYMRSLVVPDGFVFDIIK